MKTNNIPKYKIFDFQSTYAWVRTANGTYFVDPNHEKEFLQLFS